MKRLVAVLIVGMLAASSASAGIHYRARTYQDGANAAEQMNMTVEAWIDGQNAKILFQESGNPFMTKGTYLVTSDGGQTLYLVNPEEQTYSEWDLDAILQMAGNAMQSMGPMLDFKFENPRVETLLEEDGGKIHGYSTVHHRFRTTYTMHMKIMGMKRSQGHQSVQDIWSTDDIDHEALGVWLKREPPSMGDTGLKELVEAEMSKMKGFPLKTVDEVTTTGKKGRQQVTRTIAEVEELGETSIDSSTYEIPAGFQQVQMMPQSEEQEGGGIGGLFDRKPKDG
jgi:hypothetical protein